MPVKTVRTQLLALLRPSLPTATWNLARGAQAWLLLPHEDNTDTITQPTLILSMQEIERHPAAPMAKQLVTFTLRLAVPSEDFRKREDQLDEAVQKLLYAIDAGGSGIAWTSARKVMHRDRYLAFDVSMTVTIDRGDETPEPTTTSTTKRKR